METPRPSDNRPSFPPPIRQRGMSLLLLGLLSVHWTSPVLAQTPNREILIPPPRPPQTQNTSELGIYTLGGGDNVQITVFDLPQLSGQYQIPAGGLIQLPLIGGVFLQGVTLEQATTRIAAAYSKIVKNPQVTVSLSATRPLNIWISGEVNRPGSYTLALNSGAGNAPSVQFPTLVQALEKAQGVTQLGDIRRVELRRQINGKETSYYLNLWDSLKSGKVYGDVTLRDRDVIFVPKVSQVNLTESRQLGTTTFSTPLDLPRNIVIVGEVLRPGNYAVQGGSSGTDPGPGSRGAGLPTVTRAIQVAGGIKPLADIRQVQVKRMSRTGMTETVTINLWELIHSGDLTQDLILQEGDAIIVPTATTINPAELSLLVDSSFAPNEISVSVVGEVRAPGLLKVRPNTPLNQAIMTAGGFAPSRAHNSFVTLIRLNFDGTVSRRVVMLDFAKGINEETNPLLRDRDIIVIRRSGTAQFTDNINLVLAPIGNFLATVSFFNAMFSVLDRLGITQPK